MSHHERRKALRQHDRPRLYQPKEVALLPCHLRIRCNQQQTPSNPVPDPDQDIREERKVNVAVLVDPQKQPDVEIEQPIDEHPTHEAP